MIANDSKIRADVEQAPELFAPEVVLTLAKRAGYDGEVAPKIAISEARRSKRRPRKDEDG